MKINTLLLPWKGDTRYTQISGRAAALKKARLDGPAITERLEAEFGRAALLAGLRETALTAFVCGEDIDPAAISQLTLALRLPIALGGP